MWDPASNQDSIPAELLVYNYGGDISYTLCDMFASHLFYRQNFLILLFLLITSIIIIIIITIIIIVIIIVIIIFIIIIVIIIIIIFVY